MRAAIIRGYGVDAGYEIVEDALAPTATPGTVIIRAHAASLNPLDSRIRRGELRWFSPGELPRVLGHDVAGTIVEVGDGVDGFAVGDRVYAFVDANERPSWRGFARGGSFAQLVRCRADVVAPMPRTLDFAAAAAVPLAGLTAYQALTERVQIGPESRVLVHGAGGGVGSYAVQIARALGADVVAYASRRSESALRRLGVPSVVAREDVAFAEIEGPFDVVYDVAATLTYADVAPRLAAGGVFLSNVASPASVACTLVEPLRRRGVGHRHRHVWVRPDGAGLRALRALIDDGRVVPLVAGVYDLEALDEANARLDAGGVVGKLVITLGDDRRRLDQRHAP